MQSGGATFIHNGPRYQSHRAGETGQFDSFDARRLGGDLTLDRLRLVRGQERAVAVVDLQFILFGEPDRTEAIHFKTPAAEETIANQQRLAHLFITSSTACLKDSSYAMTDCFSVSPGSHRARMK